MRKNKRLLLTLFLTALPAMAQTPDYFTQEVLSRAFEHIAAAVGLVEYTAEITNESSGEISRRDSNALALVVSPDGLVMTHGHMVLDNKQPFTIKVVLGEGENEKEYEATLLKKPDDVNIVFLRLQSETPLNLPYVSFEESGALGVGAPVAFFGVLGEAFDNRCLLSEARVGAVLEKPRRTYCLDSTIRFGFVGGPVIDTKGRTAGVIGFDLSRQEGGDLHVRHGHPLIYQTALFRKYIEHPPSETEVHDKEADAWLGVFTQPLTSDYSAYWGLDREGGLIVSTVVKPSPANDAGLRRGDIIIAFDGTPIRAQQDRDVAGFTRLVRETEPGKEVIVRVLRGGKPLTLTLALGERPRSAQDADEYEAPYFGLTVREITTDVRIALNLDEEVRGVIVRRVESGSAAQLAKMRPGIIILRFGDYPVTGIESFREAVEKVAEARPEEVPVFARYGPATGFFRLEPRWEEE
jgi:serine protease Do